MNYIFYMSIKNCQYLARQPSSTLIDIKGFCKKRKQDFWGCMVYEMLPSCGTVDEKGQDNKQ